MVVTGLLRDNANISTGIATPHVFPGDGEIRCFNYINNTKYTINNTSRNITLVSFDESPCAYNYVGNHLLVCTPPAFPTRRVLIIYNEQHQTHSKLHLAR